MKTRKPRIRYDRVACLLIDTIRMEGEMQDVLDSYAQLNYVMPTQREIDLAEKLWSIHEMSDWAAGLLAKDIPRWMKKYGKLYKGLKPGEY